jgi:hypothetical protein
MSGRLREGGESNDNGGEGYDSTGLGILMVRRGGNLVLIVGDRVTCGWLPIELGWCSVCVVAEEALLG